MNAPQIHLMLNHVPVLGMLFATATLGAGLLWRNGTLLRFAVVTLVVVSLAAIPVYFSGGASEEAVERLAGVGKSSIERHEDLAKVVTIGLVALGLASLLALIRYRRRALPPPVAATMLAAALALSGALAWTAHLGGEIRHAEIRGASTAAPVTSPEADEGSEHE